MWYSLPKFNWQRHRINESSMDECCSEVGTSESQTKSSNFGYCNWHHQGRYWPSVCDLLDTNKWHGNFLEMVLLMSKYNSTLKSLIDKSIKKAEKQGKGRGKFVTFLSKTFVNSILLSCWTDRRRNRECDQCRRQQEIRWNDEWDSWCLGPIRWLLLYLLQILEKYKNNCWVSKLSHLGDALWNQLAAKLQS